MSSSAVKGMSIGIGIAVVVAGSLLLAWGATRPGPMAFVGGKTVALDAYNGRPTGVPSDFRETDLVTRGRYLSEAADCQACHTAEGGTAFAGGRPFKTAVGTIYSPNITPDAQTGIGQWGDADFVRAVHEGVSRNGARLYPAFPYDAYTYIANEDVLAIKAYLFSLAPVKNVPPKSSMIFPFNQRWLMSVWSLLFNPNERFRPAADHDAEWNRGAYLVEALAHCGDCHTPRNLLQGLDNEHKFAGAMTEGWNAYNITSAPLSGVGAWSDSDLAQYLSTGHAAGRGTASGPMAEAVDLSFARLTAGDIRAIVVYLRSVPAIETPSLPAPKSIAAPADPKQGLAADFEPHGKQFFAGACASCHSWTGVSPLSPQATLTGTRAVNDPSATNVAQIVLRGSKRQTHDDTLVMPGFGASYGDDEIAAVANYVTARFGAKASSLTANDVRKLREMQ